MKNSKSSATNATGVFYQNANIEELQNAKEIAELLGLFDIAEEMQADIEQKELSDLLNVKLDCFNKLLNKGGFECFFQLEDDEIGEKYLYIFNIIEKYKLKKTIKTVNNNKKSKSI